MTRIAINGSKGKMGQTLIEAVHSNSKAELALVLIKEIS